ncbi:lgc-14, partial [Pristionchus pacificus]
LLSILPLITADNDTFTPQELDMIEQIAPPEADFYFMNQKLFEDLMSNYKKELSPYYTNHHVNPLPSNWYHPPPMATQVVLTYARIVKMDQVEQVMRVIAEFRMIWHDYRLKWNESDYGGIKHMYVNRASVWTPEITVANSESATDAVPEHKQNVLINSTGHLLYYYSVLANSVVRLETKNFPFDKQECPLCLVETFFNKNESKVYAGISPDINYNISGNGEWDLTSLKTFRKTLPDYHMVEFDLMCFLFTLKRKSNFYVMVIIIPTFIITALTITGIFGKRMSGDDFIGELSLGLTSLMTMTVMLGIVADSLPKTDHLPVLSVFLTIDVSLMAISVLLVIIHPRILYPQMKKIKSRVFKPKEDEEENGKCFFGLLPKSMKAYMTANLFFMLIFQAINFGSLYYILSFWK